MLKHFNKFLIITFLYFLFNNIVLAKDIKVLIVNTTFNKSTKVDSVQLLKLSGGMQVVQTKKNVVSQTTFFDVPYIETPYLLQTKYQGVLYNTVVPPIPSQEKTQLYKIEVNERSSNFTENIGLVVLYSFVYTEKKLQVTIYYNFKNNTKYTFSEKELGIYTYIPLNAKDIEASVSVGKNNPESTIQWLRITPQKRIKPFDYYYNYLLPYPIKVGEKTYIVKYNLEYNGELLLLDIVSAYPPSKTQKIKFITNPDNLNFQISNSSYVFTPQKDENVKFIYYEFPSFQKKIQVSISGGTPISKKEFSSSQAVILTRITSSSDKIILFIFLFSFLLFIIWQIKKRIHIFNLILEKQYLKKKHKLEYLKKINAPLLKIKKLEKKIKNLENY